MGGVQLYSARARPGRRATNSFTWPRSPSRAARRMAQTSSSLRSLGRIMATPRKRHSFYRALKGQFVQILPSITSVEFTRRRQEAYRSQMFVKAIRGILRIAEQKHRTDPDRKESPADMADKSTPQALPMVFA